jgi:hypothetical protein
VGKLAMRQQAVDIEIVIELFEITFSKILATAGITDIGR